MAVPNQLLARFPVVCASLLVALLRTPVCEAFCYFPIEYQGTFMIQTQASPAYGGHTVTYSEISVEMDAIPPWGRCHRRRGNNVILKDSTAGEDCMRCFHLTLKTPNVIQIHSEGLARCYTNEDAARATCPDDRAVQERRFKEIMLYRKQNTGGLPSIESVFCPITGRFKFTYIANNKEFRCPESTSEMSNCPRGNGLTVRFLQCNFPEMDVSFQCLGDWPGPNGDRYLALMDLREDPESRPKYRCGMYRKNDVTGQVHVSLSADSTCFAQLKNATDGYESLLLTALPDRSLPAHADASHCRFPEWTQGKWEYLAVNGNKFEFKDRTNFLTLTGRCVERENSTPPNDRFIIYTVSQCGEESYNCLWMNRRSPNVLEFQLGSQPSKQYSTSLCNDQQFNPGFWITQGRLNIADAIPCPITGDYTGVVPGVSGLCAKVASDCNNPDIMFYSVSSCENRTHVFEEREYRCLGNWEDNGILYTYTQRRDMPGFQCFSGKVVKLGEEAYIKEAGDNCVRGEDPRIYGMRISKQASCPQATPVTFVPVRPPWRPPPPPPPSVQHVPPNNKPSGSRDPYWYQAESEQPTTKPWKPVTAHPRPKHEPSAASSRSRELSIFLILVTCLVRTFL